MIKIKPEVSVLLPVYNGGLYLKEAIESILEQSFKNFEFIIINDGSTDNSKDIIESYAKKDQRIKFFNQHNKGLVATLNYGLKIAETDLIARMDADDIAFPNRLEKQVAYMKQYLNIVVLGSGVNLIDANGKFIKRIIYPTNIDVLRNVLPKACLIAHPTVMMRRDIILKLGGYDPLYKHAEDYELWLRVFERDNFSITNLPEPLLSYRQHAAKVSLKYYEQAQLATIIMQKAYKFRRIHNYDPTSNLTKLDLTALNLFQLSRQELNEAHARLIKAKLIVINKGGLLTNKDDVDDIYKQIAILKGISYGILGRLFFHIAKAYYCNGCYLKACLCFVKTIVIVYPQFLCGYKAIGD